MMDNRPPFLITIDTEGDNLWSRPREVTTENARYLPRFQQLCEKYDLKPTWLVDWDMVNCGEFVEFGKDVLQRDACEIGMHLHAWNSPPIVPLTTDDLRYQPYLMEYSREVMRDKVARLTDKLEETFDTKMLSHRAGRWGLDETYAELLMEFGYRVDCSVTPGIDWRFAKGDPRGHGGPDFRTAPHDAYQISPRSVCEAGDAELWELPMTIGPTSHGESGWKSGLRDSRRRFVRRVARRLWPEHTWMRPDGRNLSAMLDLHRSRIASGASHIEFMLHSSELMPGGSPRFPNEKSIERLYEHLEELFAAAAAICPGWAIGEVVQWRIDARIGTAMSADMG